MKTYFFATWDALRSSYWFTPSVLVLIGISFSVCLPWLDSEIANYEFPEWIKTTPNAARATLSTITGAMVAVTGTVFSITVVTLSLTSQQFGPRLLRSFMLDRVTQLVLGVFLSTALYSALILRVVEKSSDGTGPPHLSVLFGVLLMVISVAMLITFIHHVAVLIQAPSIVENVSNDLNDAIVRLFPEAIGEAPETEKQQDFENIEKDLLNQEFHSVLSTKEGYIQAHNVNGVLEFATKEGLVIRFLYRPGDFVPLNAPFAEVFGAGQCEALTEKINQSFIVGMRRTPRQDLECAVNELVEVAVRSLSPGINDPFTAINCVDRLGACLRRLATRAIPSCYRYDSERELRLILMATTFPPVLNAAFNQIRQYSSSSVSVTIRLLEVLNDIAQVTMREEDINAVRKHIDMIHRASLGFSEEQDRKDVQLRYDRASESLEQRSQSISNNR